MYKRWSNVLTVLVLGVLLPVLVVSIISKGRSRDTSDLETSVNTDVTVDNMQVTTNSETMISVMLKDKTVALMRLEDYVLGVVLAEMPVSFETEAIKAQAVVARTYTLRRAEGNIKHSEAVVCTESACCQGYKSVEAFLKNGGDLPDLEKVKDAVAETSGQVLMYDGALIEATYFSCSGGLTEDAADVWGEDIPYLQSTSSPGEEHATHYMDTVWFMKSEFEKLLGAELAGEPEDWLGAVTYTAGYGVDTIEICGVSYKGTQLRQLLGLRSTAFTIVVVGDLITVTTKGFGHRVGMSQYGADAMAINGSDYQQILAHYYQGTELIVVD